MAHSSHDHDWTSTTDDLEAAYTESLDLVSYFALESHLNAGGRSSTHPFKDLRSAARVRNRERNIHNFHRRCKSWQCRKSKQAESRHTHKVIKKTLLRSAISDVQTTVRGHICPWIQGPSKPDLIVWDANPEAEFEDMSRQIGNGAVERYNEFGENAAVFEGKSPSEFDGETFVDWAQRRISEMRAVKERRILDPKSRPALLGRTLYQYRRGYSFHPFHPLYDRRQKIPVYIGTPLTTTLPTNSYDAHGHALLRQTLTISKWWLHRCRMTNTNPHREISYSRWFGEYSWDWHRNRSGCWELGYGGCSEGERDVWDGGPIISPSYYGYYHDYGSPCWCDKFVDEEGEMRGAPEDGESCCLLEWVDWEGRRIVREEEKERLRMAEKRIEGEKVEREWIVLSRSSSATWSIVDGDDTQWKALH
ncbi:hypothetical protein DM02DRAFT_613970 [Periconia macrospinosa]|uniref:Uncharacterized protein n=1 Tax=Periconia macrospinosa TaxID=97972 RepID=A0A2V1DUR8_9PLEO|nr:hypothetical protein DM02DRAFT_613970 [Periconia macrospinosa]